MAYKIEQIEGIGAHFGRQLMTSGVNTTKDLLDKCGTVDSLRQLEMVTGISSAQLTTWAHQADLMRVSGIGPEFGQLLERSGVETVKQLAKRDPENITHLLARVNAEKKLTRAVPPLKTVKRWVDQAKTMTGAGAPMSGEMRPPMAGVPDTNPPVANKPADTALPGMISRPADTPAEKPEARSWSDPQKATPPWKPDGVLNR